MAVHATARSGWAQTRLMDHIAGLSLPGTPYIYRTEEAAINVCQLPAPHVRVTFDEIAPIRDGRISATQSAYRMALLVVCDLFWASADREETPSLSQLDQAADELREALVYLDLSFLDYSTPSAPVAVDGASLRIHQPVVVRRLDADAGFRRRRVQAVCEWHARFDDFAA